MQIFDYIAKKNAMKKIIFLIGLSLVFSFAVWAQKKTDFRHYPQMSKLRALKIDDFGNKWMGGDEGFAVFISDSVWRMYNNPKTYDTLLRNVVAMCIDFKHQKWVAAKMNNTVLIVKLDINGDYLVHYQTPNFQNKNLSATSIAADKKGRVWIGTAEGGLWMLDTFGKWYCFDTQTTQEELPTNVITALVADNEDNIFIGTDQGLFSTKDGKEFWVYNVYDYVTTLFYTDHDVCACGVDEKRRQFIACNKQTAKKNTQSRVLRAARRSDWVFNDVILDNNGAVWGASFLLTRYDSMDAPNPKKPKIEDWTYFTKDNSNFASKDARVLAIDTADVLWIATYDNALFSLDIAKKEDKKMMEELLAEVKKTEPVKETVAESFISAEPPKKEKKPVVIKEEKPKIIEKKEEIITFGTEEIKIGEKFEMSTLQFEANSDIVSGDSKTLLDDLVKTMNTFKDVRLIIEGHTSHGARYILSLKRAQAVKNYLTDKGISEKRVVAKGFGASKLKNESDPKSHQNRRVEITFEK